MVLNLTRPVTSATFPAIATHREQVLKYGYAEGQDDCKSALSGLSKDALLVEIKKMRRDMRGHERRKKHHIEKLEKLDRLMMIEADVSLWAKDFLVFQKPVAGSSGALRQALRDQDDVFSTHEVIADVPIQSFEEVFEGSEIFRVEHDWFKAIRKADEFEGGSFRLPFEACIFEFQVSRKPVIAMCLNYAADEANNEIVMQLAVESFFGWFLSHNLYRHNGSGWEVLQGGQSIKDDYLEHLVDLVGNQIRAACIALDADVAATTLVRQPYVGATKDSAEQPAYEFYTISIASRTRAEALQAHGASKGTKRLHFRRGHWRHFTASKTWVRWCLVGNPELGFIDKQYRL